MSAVLVDSNVLLDVITGDKQWSPWSEETLQRTADSARLVINPVIYAEVSVGFVRIEDLEEKLPQSFFERAPIPYEAAFLAGKAFAAYRKRGGARVSTLPDFFIGAHAAVAGLRLMTRDAARYRTYFPRLDLIAPN